MNGKVRRVVTGHDASGKAVVAMDGDAPLIITHPTRLGYFLTQIWTTKEAPAVIDSGPDLTVSQLPLSPPEQGTVIRVIEFPPEPESLRKLDAAGARAALVAIGGHTASTFRPGALHPLMHRTQSIDYAIVLKGSIYLVLDDTETLINEGEFVIQRGTNHAWSNRSGAPCRVAFILIGGRFEPELEKALAGR